MVEAKDILRKLTVRNTVALAFVGVFLYGVVMQINLETSVITRVLAEVESMTPTEALTTGAIGGGIGGVFFAMVKDIVQFYFRGNRRNGSGESN